jgi:hypothetical protein
MRRLRRTFVARRRRRVAVSLGLSLIAPLLAATPAFASGSGDPAKGAPLDQVLIGTVVACAATAAVIWVAMAHRSGRITWLARLGDFSERVSGLPAWSALPSAVVGGSLAIAVFGFYWDVAKHIDTGRDPGPFGTAAHYPILIGLFGLAVGGFLAIALGAPKEVPTSVRLTSTWRAPLGGLLIFLCGGFALTGFPLDDVWHTLFGQDVTLWGPTHVLMIGGASLATLGAWVLLVEGQRARHLTSAGRHASPPLVTHLRSVGMGGAFLLGLSTLQGEFDYGVPQFQMVYQPILIALAAGVGLVAARVRLGRFGALQAVGFFLAVRGLLTLVIGPVFGMSTLHFPLYVVEALLVEAAAARIPRERPLTLGAVSGVLIGTIGLAAEWGWSHVWMPLPWPSSMLLPAAVLGLAAAVAGGVLGGYVGRALTSHANERQHGPRWLLPAAAAVAVACIAFPLPMNSGSTTAASFTLTPLNSGPKRTVAATVRLTPRNAADHAQWLTVTAWQGGGLVVDRLRRVADGVYQTTQPIPVYGKWKAMLRMENGRGVRAVPIYLPADPAIPAAAVTASASFTREFVRDKKILQREAVGGSVFLTTPAYLLLLAIATGWLIALGRGLGWLERTSEDSGSGGRPRVRARAGAPSPA